MRWIRYERDGAIRFGAIDRKEVREVEGEPRARAP
jgi:hypothetical protein